MGRKNRNKWLGICILALLLMAGTASGGITNHIYGHVSNSSDGMAGVNATNNGFAIAYDLTSGNVADSRNAAQGTQMNDGYFFYDAGSLWASWAAGDDVVVVTEVNSTVSKNGANYTAATNKTKTTASPDAFPDCTLEKIPTPVMSSNGSNYINLAWTGLKDANSNVTGFNVVNYSVYRSTDNVSYSFIGNSTPQVSNGNVYYNDTGVSPCAAYYYKLRVRFRGGYQTEGYGNASLLINTSCPPPAITFYSPSTPITSGEGQPKTFTVSTDQNVNVTWQLNGITKQSNMSVTSASYTNQSGVLGLWNVTAVASNPNGTAQQTWLWTV